MARSSAIGRLGILIFVCSSLLVPANFAPPSDVRVHALNFNLTLTWEPPEVDLLENETFLYTVERTTSGIQGGDITHCVNILETFCSLISIFPGGNGFCQREWFKVKAFSNITHALIGAKGKSFAGRDIDVSAPVVFNYTITHRNVTLWIRGPETPFEKNGKKLIMIESGLGHDLDLRDLEFNSSLFENYNPNDSGRLSLQGFEQISNGRHKLEYTRLKPNTRYIIRMQSKYGRKISSDISTFEFRTSQSAPDYGPIISDVQVLNRYCDFRDVNVTWEEHKDQRETVNLTHYEVSFRSPEKANNDINFLVPSSVQSTNVSGLSRWLDYQVTITSINSGGKKGGRMFPLEKERFGVYTDTYKANIKGITKTSRSEGKLSWEPPILHEQCIQGYEIKTYIDDSLEQSLNVEGFNTSSAVVEFKKSGKYTVELITIYNDTEWGPVTTTYEYTVKGWKGYEWVILLTVMFVLVVMFFGVIVMVKKVFCVLSTLPDISKSKPMLIISNNNYVNTSLKKPPEREFFHSVKSSKLEILCKTDLSVHHEGNDNVFLSTSTSEAPLSSEVQKEKSELESSPEIVEDQASDKPEIKDRKDDQRNTTWVKFQVQDDDTATTVHVTTPTANLEVSVTSSVDGYIARVPTKNPSLTVNIPKDSGYCPTSNLSPQSSSADSGICSSPPFGASLSDYIPPSPLAELNTPSRTSDSDEFPYVKAELAESSGRIQTYSVSSDTGSDCPNYNRIHSRQSFAGSSPTGYLPMSPSYPIDTNDNQTTLWQRPSSYFFPPNMKISPKKFTHT